MGDNHGIFYLFILNLGERYHEKYIDSIRLYLGGFKNDWFFSTSH